MTRRVMAAPIGDCTGLQNGNSTITKSWTQACVFLTEQYNKAVQTNKSWQSLLEFMSTEWRMGS